MNAQGPNGAFCVLLTGFVILRRGAVNDQRAALFCIRVQQVCLMTAHLPHAGYDHCTVFVQFRLIIQQIRFRFVKQEMSFAQRAHPSETVRGGLVRPLADQQHVRPGPHAPIVGLVRMMICKCPFDFIVTGLVFVVVQPAHHIVIHQPEIGNVFPAAQGLHGG